ncbi:hypothetical protein [Flavobacterium nackdongense]|uniref:Uncharacterized protein n=1 Tax=Flavobacterium nackdongense TaxID=2547394 RepID=A0A4P6Y8U0_9FLAO|nr:hypothetical protein [Flavobacterium nackdongense]QBN19321.1 hypothetical protein E1750_11085 [Flavobacterium nackdongense]
MGIESFDWKSLFINEEGSNQPKNEETKAPSLPQTNKFPDIELNSNVSNNSSNPFLGEVFDVYQKGFESLNQDGFDFFEMYKSVNAVGVTNPQSYQMAFTMGKTINSALTKESLLDKGKFYLTEIEKVYDKFNNTGNAKKSDLNLKITQEKKNLSNSISDLESQIAKLQKELESKRNELNKIDVNNAAQFSQFQLKIEANNLAKQKIQESINIVITGINQYL